MKFENKVTLVTGGNFGIGYGIAKKFAEEGSEIAIVARNEERAKTVITGSMMIKRKLNKLFCIIRIVNTIFTIYS